MTQGQTIISRQDTIERQLTEQAEKWKRRRERTKDLLLTVVKSKPGAMGAGVTLLGIGTALFPQAAESVHLLIEIVLEMFK
jgi:hypothetical protein